MGHRRSCRRRQRASPSILGRASTDPAPGGTSCIIGRCSIRTSSSISGCLFRTSARHRRDNAWQSDVLLRKVMMKLTVACTLTSLMLLCTPVLACGTQLNPLPCQPAAGLGRRRANLFLRLVSGRCRRLAPARVAVDMPRVKGWPSRVNDWRTCVRARRAGRRNRYPRPLDLSARDCGFFVWTHTNCAQVLRERPSNPQLGMVSCLDA